MSQVSIKKFAETLTMSVEKLLTQLQEAGVKGKKESDTLSEDEKLTLLTYLKGLHGDKNDAPNKVTLKESRCRN